MGFVRKINWELLKKQKETLIRLACENSNNTCLSKEEQSDLDGVVYLIDAVQDWAVDDQGVAKELVFPNMEEDSKKEKVIDDINHYIEKHGEFTVADVHADRSPSVEVPGKLSHLMEEFREDQGRVCVYDPNARGNAEELDEYDEEYYQLPLSELEYILSLAKKWADINE